MRYKINKLIVLIIVLSLFITFSIDAKEPQEIAKYSFESVVLIKTFDKNDLIHSMGSGFFVEQNTIATNMHVIKGAYRGIIKLLNNDKEIPIKVIKAKDEKHDLALLTVNGNYPKLSLGNSDKVNIGQRVYVVGNPMGLEGTFSEGIVSSIRQVEEIKLIQITAPISSGSSGGPVLDKNGEVIGISFAQFIIGQNLNFAIPVNYLIELIEAEPSFNEVEETKSEPVKKTPSLPPLPTPTAGELILGSPCPIYPKDLIGEAVMGNVTLLVHVQVNGEIEWVEIIQSSGNEKMDKTASLTLERGWKFKSYKQPYSLVIIVEYKFDNDGNPDVDVKQGKLTFK
jgi:TonB family protein